MQKYENNPVEVHPTILNFLIFKCFMDHSTQIQRNTLNFKMIY